ncbi:MAG: hypothetical protein HFE58_11750 [Firmicutes bacterium]|nr:hypothetical protein [Bacillota bacterium]
MLNRLTENNITDHIKKKNANTFIRVLLFSFAFCNTVYPIRKRIPESNNAPIIVKKWCIA